MNAIATALIVALVVIGLGLCAMLAKLTLRIEILKEQRETAMELSNRWEEAYHTNSKNLLAVMREKFQLSIELNEFKDWINSTPELRKLAAARHKTMSEMRVEEAPVHSSRVGRIVVGKFNSKGENVDEQV